MDIPKKKDEKEWGIGYKSTLKVLPFHRDGQERDFSLVRFYSESNRKGTFSYMTTNFVLFWCGHVCVRLELVGLSSDRRRQFGESLSVRTSSGVSKTDVSDGRVLLKPLMPDRIR